MSQQTFEVQVDNPSVRVTRWTLGAGEETGTHHHEYDYVVVPVADAKMLVEDTDGTLTTSELRSGTAYYRTAGVEHNVSNDGDELLDFVEVEVVRGQNTDGHRDVMRHSNLICRTPRRLRHLAETVSRLRRLLPRRANQ
jgi:quercetin dioxygenase-like cupin family protein